MSAVYGEGWEDDDPKNYRDVDILIARVRESVEEEQRGKYQELVKALSEIHTRLEALDDGVESGSAADDQIGEAWLIADCALFSTEIKGETA